MILWIITGLVFISATVYSLWFTVIAFVGGRVPLLGWKLSGGFISGLFWSFLGDLVIFTVAHWIVLLITLLTVPFRLPRRPDR